MALMNILKINDESRGMFYIGLMDRIGIYDSGCGGLSVLNQLIKQGFRGTVFYYGDTLNNPWGNKSKKELEKTLYTIADWFSKNHITTVYPGCNTTLGLFKDKLSQILHCPVATILDDTSHFYTDPQYSVLCTINSFNHHLFKQFLYQKTVEEIPCPNLASLIESNQLSDAVNVALSMIDQCSYSSIILGCTHYPLIMDELKKHCPNHVFIDPATYLKVNGTPQIKNKDIDVHFKITGDPHAFKVLLNQFSLVQNVNINNQRILQHQ